ncbi:MAG TPA: MarR family transcriptional regulator [Bacilli bacterium]|nr:MarR family transcriptional regulator [Bacilli bacterium]
MTKDVHELFSQLLHRYSGDFRRELKNDVTGPQLLLLERLYLGGPMKMSDCAEQLRLTVSAVTLQADKLLKIGYLDRTRSEEDRRVVMLSLTEEGRRVLEEYLAIRKRVLDHYFGKLTTEELQTFGRLFQKILAEPNG